MNHTSPVWINCKPNMIKYLTFSLSIAFISWIVGMIMSAFLSKTTFYKSRLSHFSFIKNEKVNLYLGLEPFKWLIMNTFFKFFNPKLSISKKITVSQLGEYRAEMTTAELNHLFAFIFMLAFVLVKIIKGLYLFALIMLLVNILMNLYPSLLQQQNKRRIDQFLAKLKLRTNPLS